MNPHLHPLALAVERDPAQAGAERSPRGRRAARLRLARAYVLHHLAEQGLNAERVGKHLSISGRAVQMLFEAEGTTLSGFLLEQRLLQALRQLRDPRLDTLAISQVAYSAGFADLSHFNRRFRRRFGVTPSVARHSVS